MTELPAPLTPTDCDLRDFSFMPLDVGRLRDSDLASLSTGNEFRSAVLLWCASWHQVPAASLPDDDAVLAKLAGFGFVVKEWKKLRKGAMRGWIKCSDGRWYHPVVAEKANDSWDAKHKHAYDKLVDRLRKKNKDRAQKQLPPVEILSFEEWKSIGMPMENELFPPETKPPSTGITPEKRLKGQGQGQGQGKLTKTKSSDTSNSVGAADTGKPDDSIFKKRQEQIGTLLWSLGISPISENHALVIEWARNPKITDALLKRVVAKARKHNDSPKISPNYIAPIIVEQLMPKPDTAWQKSDQATDAKGRELGMLARGNESYPEYRNRISDELRRRKHAAQTEGVAA